MKSNKAKDIPTTYSSTIFSFEQKPKDETKKEIIARINQLNEKLSPKRAYNYGNFQNLRNYESDIKNNKISTQFQQKPKFFNENYVSRRESEPHQELTQTPQIKTDQKDNKLEEENQNEIKQLTEELEAKKKLLNEKKKLHEEKVIF